MKRKLIAGLALACLVSVCAHASDDALTCPVGSANATAGTSTRDAAAETLFTRPEESVPASKRTNRGLYVTAQDTYDMLQESAAKVLFVDVRTRGELQFIGMPTLVDVHVPYLVEAEPPQWDEASSAFKLVPNAGFVAGVDRALARKQLDRDAPVIVLCQGGLRAARAANALTAAGYRNVYAVIDGFEGDPAADGPAKGQRIVNGWRNAGLPWTTRLDRVVVFAGD